MTTTSGPQQSSPVAKEPVGQLPGVSTDQNQDVAAISPHVTKTAEKMLVADVVDYAKKFERAAAAPKYQWVAPLGVLLLGGALGALLAGKGMNTAITVSFILGVALVVFSRMIRASRTENLDAICDDFREYLERWPMVASHPLSPEYERLVAQRATRHDPNASLRDRLKAWWL